MPEPSPKRLHMNYPGWGTEVQYLYDGYTIILTKAEFDRRINDAFNAGVRLGEMKGKDEQPNSDTRSDDTSGDTTEG